MSTQHRPMTQTERVLALLRERGEVGVTPLEALDRIGSFRLAARIAEAKLLIGADERIDTERMPLAGGKSVARYVLRRREASRLTLW